MLDVGLVGTGGMMPLYNRWLASAVIRYKGRCILVDCGEGTQVPLRGIGWGFANIDAILFTHYHADHVAGLPGLLLTIGNSGRKEPLLIVGPPPLSSVISGLTVITPGLPYKINFMEVKGDPYKPLYIGDILVRNMAVNHGMPCVCYSFEIKRRGEFSVDKAKELNIPVKFWGRLQKGEVIDYNGIQLVPNMVLGPARKGLKISYCVDTRPTVDIPWFIENSDLFICEGMYGDNNDIDKAEEKKHMLFREAAAVAEAGKVKELWLTHFSPAMRRPQEYIDNARLIFKNTHIGVDLVVTSLKFED